MEKNKETTENFPKTLEDYKQSVRNYLLNELKISTEVTESRMKEYEGSLEGYWEEKLPVSAMATGMMYYYL